MLDPPTLPFSLFTLFKALLRDITLELMNVPHIVAMLSNVASGVATMKEATVIKVMLYAQIEKVVVWHSNCFYDFLFR